MERNDGGGGVVVPFVRGGVDFIRGGVDSGRRDWGEEGADLGRDRLLEACRLIFMDQY
jgi:hypothetical protein